MDDKLLVSQLQAHCSQLRGNSITVGNGVRKEKGLGSFCDISVNEIRSWDPLDSSGKEEERALLWVVLMKEL